MKLQTKVCPISSLIDTPIWTLRRVNETKEFSSKVMCASLDQPRRNSGRYKEKACREDIEKTGKSQQRVKIITKSDTFESLSVAPSQESKIKFHVVPSLLCP